MKDRKKRFRTSNSYVKKRGYSAELSPKSKNDKIQVGAIAEPVTLVIGENVAVISGAVFVAKISSLPTFKTSSNYKSKVRLRGASLSTEFHPKIRFTASEFEKAMQTASENIETNIKELTK
jgi:hypothetical protein